MPESSSPFEQYHRAWRARWQAEQTEDEVLGARARAVVADLAQLLKREYGVRRVVLFGSLARGEFRRGSDIDLAVEGLADTDFFAAGAALERASGGFEVDLVQIECASRALAEAIQQEGVPVA